MINEYILLVKDREGLYEEILIDIDYNGFSYDYEINGIRQLSFTALLTPYNEYSFHLLANESIIVYQGQEFIIKQCTPQVKGSTYTKNVIAVHVSLCVTEDHYQYDSKEESGTYTLEDIMKFALKDNKLGITYEIIGTFSKKTIETIGANTAKNIIKEIGCDTFGAIFYADNKHIKMYSESEWYRSAQYTFRHHYNTDEITVDYNTTNMKTFIKAYGKPKENKDAKTDTSIATSSITYGANWSSGKTSKKDSTASFTFTGTGVDVYFRKAKLGGKVHVDVDGANAKTGTTYSEKEGTLTLTIRGLDNKKHTCNIKFTGEDTKNPNTKKKKTTQPYTKTLNSGKIERKTKVVYTQEASTLEVENPIANIYMENEGDNRYEVVVEYESPASKDWGLKLAPAVSNDKISTKSELLEYAMSQLRDYPDMSLNISYKGTQYVDVRDVWVLIHEPLGITTDVSLVSLKSPHPFTNSPQDLTFSNTRIDMLKIQNQINKKMTNLAKSLSSVGKVVSGTLPGLQEASRAISAVSGKVDFDPEHGIKTTRTTTVTTPSPAIFSTMEDIETVIEDGSVYMGDGIITAVNKDGIESDVITPDGVNLSASYGTLPDEIIDDITDRIDLSGDYLFITSPSGYRFTFSVDDAGKLTMVRV